VGEEVTSSGTGAHDSSPHGPAADFAWMRAFCTNRLTVQGDFYSARKTFPPPAVRSVGRQYSGRWTHATPGGASMNLQFYTTIRTCRNRSPQSLRLLLSSVAFPPAP